MNNAGSMRDLIQRAIESFPRVEEFVDCRGLSRSFTFYLRELPGGYLVEAREEAAAPYGYRFEAFDASDPMRALGELRGKIPKALSRKYLRHNCSAADMTHDEISGWIGNDGLVVDGTLVGWEDLKRILLVREGFAIRIRISPPSET